MVSIHGLKSQLKFSLRWQWQTFIFITDGFSVNWFQKFESFSMNSFTHTHNTARTFRMKKFESWKIVWIFFKNRTKFLFFFFKLEIFHLFLTFNFRAILSFKPFKVSSQFKFRSILCSFAIRISNKLTSKLSAKPKVQSKFGNNLRCFFLRIFQA